ncbi:phage holin family protein [Nocardioides sp. MAH-18]|uniref:Phage holin family protein n=1 Tax=Nocardioides agri TaxID=2682843 RepID=A0A6L6XV14_9ACTN|nr:phage holin family protein [Nocardioides sp. CGMCC 1.13656]MBA2955476.1 phage holin family protein [Nocardioides sp. CGMCC 1.13656]MVQ50326.1 phage holin family protein [Nocardioides sp. MAH-18]
MSVTPTPDVGPGPASDGRSIGEIVGDVTQDLTTLIRQEIDLAKTELKEEGTKAAKGAGMLGGAGLAGFFAVLFLSTTLMFVLDEFLELWLAALIVTAVWAVATAALAVIGKNKLQASRPQLPQTQETLKEDVRWAKAQKN